MRGAGRRAPATSVAAKRQFRFLKPTIVSLFPKRGVQSPKGGKRSGQERVFAAGSTPLRGGKVDREVFASPVQEISVPFADVQPTSGSKIKVVLQLPKSTVNIL